MKTIRTMKWIIAAVFLCCFINQATAAEYSYTQSDGTHTIRLATSGTGFTVNGNSTVYTAISAIKVTGGTLNIYFQNTLPVNLSGQILLTGGTINILRVGEDSTEDNPTLKKKNGNPNARITVDPPTNGSARLNFNYDDAAPLFVYDGGCMDFNIEPYGDFYRATATGQNNKNFALIEMPSGKCYMKNTVLTNNWNIYGDDRNGGAFNLYKNSAGRGFTLEMTNCTIKNCYSKQSGSAIYFVDAINGPSSSYKSSITLTDCTITNCFVYADNGANGMGGTIRTLSSNYASLTMTGCNIDGNYSVRGGALLWNAARAPMPHLEDCSFTNNWEKSIGGAALYIQGSMELERCNITNNHTLASGGGVFYSSPSPPSGLSGYTPGSSGTLTIDDQTEISNNEAALDGGGLYIYTKAINSSYPVTSFTLNLEVNGATISDNKAGRNGGGIYLTKDNVPYTSELHINYGSIRGNRATGNGGAVCVEGLANNPLPAFIGTPTGTEDLVIANDTATYGGGIYVKYGDVTFYRGQMGGVDLTDPTHPVYLTNVASGGDGGGIYVDGGSFNMYGGTFAYNEATKSGGTGGNGGGFYVNNGTIDVEGGLITHNTATDKGGGFYVDPTNATDTTFIKQGALGAEVSYNQAHDGGAAYVLEGVLSLEGSTIGHNTAVNGGAFYSAAGMIDFSGGLIEENYASGNGGGIYVAPDATVKLRGNAELKLNHVPYANGPSVGHGGGIYLAGQVLVGNKATDEQGYHTLKVQTNYEGTPTKLNNIYLLTESNVIELLSDMRGSTTTRVGFSVDNGFRKVVKHAGDATTSSDSWLHGLLAGGSGMNGVIFDDAQKYMAVHVLTSDDTFDHNYIYLWGCWISAVNKDPNQHITDGLYPLPPGATFTQHYEVVGGVWHIYTKEGLAWFSSYVNGLNGNTYDANVNPKAKAVMECDVDLHEFLWVPLGSAQSFNPAGLTPGSSLFTDGHTFAGEFDGQGHTISGLDCRYINSLHNYGLFGDVVGDAKISNVLVDDFRYNCNQETGTPTAYVMGGIAGRAGGNAVISNCEARGVMTSPVATTSIMGGIVGVLETGGTVHSCIGIPTIEGDGLYKGGIAGQTEAGTFVMNSFANASFPLPTGLTYVPGTLGGLVGENSGTVENCYARVQGGAPNDDTHFGWLVGANTTSGQVNYCYSPANDRYYHEGENDGTLTGCGHYDNTQVPYLYARRDNQIETASATVNNGGTTNTHIPSGTPHPGCVAIDQQMLICLNNWVTAKNSETGSHPIYTEWLRPTTKVINDDLPLLMMTGFDAVAATNGDAFLNYGQVNTLLDAYKNATQAVWLYRNKDGLAGNASSSAKLYIAPNVAVKQSATVNAYVGVMLDNSAGVNGANPTFGDGTPDYTDWHMFSSPLVAAPLGINYVKTDGTTPDNTQWGDQFEYGHPSGMPYYLHTGEGYFPTHRYGTSLPANNGAPTASGNEGNYYQEWDFYTYYEPEYHWINFKRNSNSHWHENAPTAPLGYTHYDSQTGSTVAGNETYLTRGRGYLLATREETFLQCSGQLTDGNVTIPVTVDGAYSPGYNFLGNPYLSYLNFDEFITQNTGNAALFSSGLAGYAIIDEDPVPGETPEHAAARGGYKYYTYNNSANTYGATKYIAPHQGFMILAANAGTATFTNDMREADIDRGHFRGTEQPAYALVNLLAYDGNGNRDITTVELGRPDKGGLPLMRELKLATCHVYSRYDDEDWTIAFTQPGISEVPVRFEAYADGEYTLRWNTQNGDFHYLHLVDNQTGADVDCLAADEYRFTATTEDYRSRFRLVFGYTGIEEPEAEDIQNTTFAFQSGKELVVTGEGTLTMFDVTGRAVMSAETYGVQTAAPLPKVAAGVYLLRLETVNGTKVQKIVIK